MAQAARSRGLEPVVVPLITDAPPADPAALDAALARLGAVPAAPAGEASGQRADGPRDDPAGRRDAPPTDRSGPDRVATGAPWLVVTSATAVRVVAGRVPRLPAGVRVACVGAATARAARAAGWPVDLVPEDESAAGLVAAFPADAGPVLTPRSEIAAPTLVDGLRARGLAVSEVVAYRTVGTGDDPLVLTPPPDAVLVTSGSVADQVVRRMTPLDPRTRIACIGPSTADAARAAGLPVHVVARSRSAEALLDAVVETLHPNPRTGRSS
ncbi:MULTISPECIES: uroporphyrinogen-III synthase [unclassified Curtobacterium]|uniref:uroporphyrinogen-III synthase n=1 Tax=unclassified Curtobacterium TaxID=257496 RepID=UPI000824D965|nr:MULTISPECIES: uroporphyrinogen-III synthase [unclassified Curtobacterium]WIA96891.1 uroporphyrinogen-III synthase [Curtobacterium sp. MCBA15_004]WIB00193.1 uroporphyrinogen-III synthase [Curtobacterium sp. MCBA15_012]